MIALRKTLPLLTLFCALGVAPATAFAHVSAVPAQAKVGSYAVVAFRVGHGCAAGVATTSLRVETPADIVSVRYQPKPGWTVKVERQGGKVSAVTWTGRLPDDQFDDFSLQLQMPAKPGVLYFPAIQACGATRQQWTEIVGPGESATHPAPKVTLVPATAAPGPTPAPAHDHEHM